jgi:hypothetical protein
VVHSAMLISTIVLIVVRLFSVQWLVQGLTMLVVVVTGLSEIGPVQSEWIVPMRILPSMLVLALSVVAWLVSPLLSRLIAGRYDASVTFSLMSLQDLYSFAFVFLGLYFVLSSLGDALNWLQYWFVFNASHGDSDPERKRSFYGMSRSLITLVAGFLCLLYGKKWAKRLHSAPEAS